MKLSEPVVVDPFTKDSTEEREAASVVSVSTKGDGIFKRSREEWRRLPFSQKAGVLVSLVGALFLDGFALLSVFTFLDGSEGAFPQSGVVWVGPEPLSERSASPSAPAKEVRKVACPLNGQEYSEEYAASFQNRRPLGIIVENHISARPQSGLIYADLLYEMVAEGGITRFLAIYLCNGAEKVGPVRSARVYYLDYLSEFDGLFAHIGGAVTPGSPANAYDYIARFKIKDLDQFKLGSPTYWRIDERPSPHNVYTSTQNLYLMAKERGWGDAAAFDPWQFKESGSSWSAPFSTASAGIIKAAKITIGFWNGYSQYDVVYEYDSARNEYLRSNGGALHSDAESGERLTAKNVVVQFVKERPAGDGTAHLLYTTIAEGKAKVFKDGQVIEAVWKKPSRTARTRYFNAAGQEIVFARGKTYIAVVPLGAQLSFEQ